VVSRVGGLADTVVDATDEARCDADRNGVSFLPVTEEGLASAIKRTLALWSDQPRWKRVQARAMTVDVSWKEPAREYAALYRESRSHLLCPDELPQRPRLERASARRVRRVAVRDLEQVIDAAAPTRAASGSTNRCRASAFVAASLAVHAQPRVDERGHEPWPHRALVIRAVALLGAPS
jgi:hypothetical protein